MKQTLRKHNAAYAEQMRIFRRAAALLGLLPLPPPPAAATQPAPHVLSLPPAFFLSSFPQGEPGVRDGGGGGGEPQRERGCAARRWTLLLLLLLLLLLPWPKISVSSAAAHQRQCPCLCAAAASEEERELNTDEEEEAKFKQGASLSFFLPSSLCLFCILHLVRFGPGALCCSQPSPPGPRPRPPAVPAVSVPAVRTGVVQRPKDKILSMDPKEITCAALAPAGRQRGVAGCVVEGPLKRLRAAHGVPPPCLALTWLSACHAFPPPCSYEMVQKKLQEISMARGKTTRIDRQEQVRRSGGGGMCLLAGCWGLAFVFCDCGPLS